MTMTNSRHSAFYNVGGLTICLTDAPEPVSFSMGKAFSLGQTVSGSNNIFMTARIEMDESYVSAMPDFVRHTYCQLPENENPVAFLGPGGEFCALVKNDGSSSYTLFRPGSSDFELICQGRSQEEAPIHFQSVLIPLIKHLLLQQGKLLVHAGCVATEGGHGILFAGLSGSGKTTTCIALTRAGFYYLSDDLVVLSFQNGRTEVEGVREHMNLTKRTIDFFPEFSFINREFKKASYRGKVSVNPETLFGADRIRDKAVIDTIMVIHIGKDGPRLVPVNPSAVLNVVLQNHTFETGMAIPRSSMDILWNILDSVRAFKLMTGPDPSAMGDHVYREYTGGKPLPSAPDTVPVRTGCKLPKPIIGSRAAELLGTVLSYTLDGTRSEAGISIGEDALRLFQHHRLEAHLARWFRDSGTVGTVAFSPDRVLSNAVALSLRRAVVTERVHNALTDAGIASMLLRGPSVAKRYYSEEALRTYRDIDLIIRKDLLTKAAGVMQELGFRADRSLGYWEPRGEWPFSDGQTVVELHWEAYPSPFHGMPGLVADDIWRDPVSITIGSTEMASLSADHLLCSSFMHAAYDHYFDRLFRLVDIRQVMKQAAASIDWGWIADMVQRSRTAVAVLKALECINAVMPLSAPEGLLDLTISAARRRLADLVLPNDRIIAGQPQPGRFRRWLFFQTIRPVR